MLLLLVDLLEDGGGTPTALPLLPSAPSSLQLLLPSPPPRFLTLVLDPCLTAPRGPIVSLTAILLLGKAISTNVPCHCWFFARRHPTPGGCSATQGSTICPGTAMVVVVAVGGAGPSSDELVTICCK